MENDPNKNLNAFRWWLLVFLLMHAPIALYNFTGGLTLVGTFIREGASWWFILLYGMLSFVLPTAIFLLLRRNPAFRWVYAGYAVLMSSNFLMQQGVNAVSVSVSVLCTVPWLLYVFRSRRVAAVLAHRRQSEE
jgi:hypothetical protein